MGLASIDVPLREDAVACLRMLSASTDALRAAIERAVDTFGAAGGADTETAAAVRAASEAVPETRAEFFAAVLALIPAQAATGAGRTDRLRLLT